MHVVEEDGGISLDTGKVLEHDTGNPLIGCNIMLSGTSMGISTDAQGEYILLNIPPGYYDVKFQMIGYENVISTNVL